MPVIWSEKQTYAVVESDASLEVLGAVGMTCLEVIFNGGLPGTDPFFHSQTRALSQRRQGSADKHNTEAAKSKNQQEPPKAGHNW